ncbi:hypothetical protein C0Q70_12250 [Pomacea canaliculata]|uniref:Ig-like domain-containing protein n=1 Tax=Pomacea canaliculata TaxID=400727 RepID=A0A2T7P119_POMCA|nr:hypothetical protein C0Q70_12250 [Pomacea canaliculata]
MFLLRLTLYLLESKKVVAFLNLKDNVCTTSESYSACLINPSVSRDARLLTLVTDLVLDEWRQYGCNVTIFKGAQTHVLVWSTRVQRQRTYVVPIKIVLTALGSDVTVVGLTLYCANTSEVLAYVNVVSRECSTSNSYSSCFIATDDTRKIRVMTLAAEIDDGKYLEYGCNVTAFKTGKGLLVSWTTRVYSPIFRDVMLDLVLKMIKLYSMVIRAFKGIPSIQEVQCSGQGLGSDITVLGLTLYCVNSSQVLAYVNILNRECSTSSGYSSCFIASDDPGKTRVMTLAAEIDDGRYLDYGCNVTSFRGGKAHYPALGSDVTVVGLTLYCVNTSEVLAYVNVVSRECSTSSSYSSCFIAADDTRKIRVKTLASEIDDGKYLEYGCNVTSLRAGKTHLVTWTTRVFAPKALWLYDVTAAPRLVRSAIVLSVQPPHKRLSPMQRKRDVLSFVLVTTL